jgi:WD40 repeat protein
MNNRILYALDMDNRSSKLTLLSIKDDGELELKYPFQDLSFSSRITVLCANAFGNMSWVAVGCGDGSLRILDIKRRLCVFTLDGGGKDRVGITSAVNCRWYLDSEMGTQPIDKLTPHLYPLAVGYIDGRVKIWTLPLILTLLYQRSLTWASSSMTSASAPTREMCACSCLN